MGYGDNKTRFFTPIRSKYRARTSAHATIRCDGGKNKTQTFSKREQMSSSVPHECPASVQSVTRVYPTPRLAGHPRSVRVGYGDNFAKSALSSSQRVSFLGTVLDSAQMRAVVGPERALAIQRLAASFKSGTTRPLRAFQRMLGLMAAASSVLQLGLLRMRPLQRWLKPRVPPHAWRHGRLHVRVNQACVTALAPWKNPPWMDRGVAMGMVCNRKVVTTDASNTGWGALCEGKPTFSHWSKAENILHINCLEMLAVCRACQFFLPDLIGRHVLIHADNMSVVSYINHQGGLSSKRLFILVERLLEWAQLNLRSLRAAHLPGRLNQGVDMLSRSNVPSEEWMLHPQMVR